MKTILLLSPTYFSLIAPGADGFFTDRSSWPVSISSERGRGLVRHPTCMHARSRLTDDDYAERKEQLRQLLCLDQKGIDKLVDSNPGVLKLDIDGNVVPKSEMLQRRLGIDQKKAGRILSCPGANRLIAQNQGVTQAGIDYLQNELGLSDKEIAKVLVSCPELLARSINGHYEPLFNALQSAFGFTQDEIANFATKTPKALQRTSAKGIESMACLLPRVLGLDEKDKKGLKKCFLKCPSLLYSTESRLNESHEWLLNFLGGSKSVAARVCQNRPQFLTTNAELFQNKVDWYRDRLSLTDEEICKVVAQYPTILTPSIEDDKMGKKLGHIKQLFKLNDEQLKELFLRRPELVALSAEENIEPKLDLYGSLIGKERARKLVVEHPNLLLESMKRRIKPRLEEVDKVYEYVEWTETLLRRLVSRKPKQWCEYMLDDAPRGPGEKLDDSGKYKRFASKR